MLATTLASVLFLGACGGFEPREGGVASLGGRGDGGVATSEDGAKSWEEAAVDFAECMREQGVDMPDPSTDGGSAPGFVIDPETDLRANEEEFRAADKTCRHLLEGVRPPEMSEEEADQVREEALAFTECMREHGIDMPDPRFGEDGSVSITVGGPGSDMDPTDPSPEFERAQEACEELAPMGPAEDQ